MPNNYQKILNNEEQRNSSHRLYLKNRRKDLHLKIYDVAMELYITESYLAQVENGKKGKKLPVSLLINLAFILKYDLDEIVKLEKAYIKSNYRGMLVE